MTVLSSSHTGESLITGRGLDDNGCASVPSSLMIYNGDVSAISLHTKDCIIELRGQSNELIVFCLFVIRTTAVVDYLQREEKGEMRIR